MNSLKWNLDLITSYHIIKHIMVLLKKGLGTADSNKIIFDTLEEVAIQYAKMLLINDKFLEYRPSEVSYKKAQTFRLELELLHKLVTSSSIWQ
jgi:hypothetical protein